MFTYLTAGFQTALKRPGLAGLLFAFNLVVGLLITVPIYTALVSSTALSGFATELTNQFDIALWADIMEDAGTAFQALFMQLLWAIPVFFLWKVLSSVGVIQTLHSEGALSFWQGIGEYGWRAVLLGLVFLVPLAAALFAVAFAVFILSLVWGGEVGTFWTYAVFLPVVLILALALLDLMHDYARMELVVGRRGVMESMLSGIAWPFRHGESNAIYIAWLVLGGIMLVLTTMLDVRAGGVLGVFLIQQLFMFVRAGMTVGWFGSEVAYYDDVVAAAEPLIADAAQPEEAVV